jgi:hypothetical protein
MAVTQPTASPTKGPLNPTWAWKSMGVIHFAVNVQHATPMAKKIHFIIACPLLVWKEAFDSSLLG